MNKENDVIHTTSNEGEFLFWCSGCNEVHAIQTSNNGAIHNFNGDFKKPTFNLKNNMPFTVIKNWYCCFKIIDGVIRYMPQSKHILAGHATEMRERKDWESFSIGRNSISGNLEVDYEK